MNELANISPANPTRCSSIAIIPCYNEARFIGSVVLMARRYVDVVIIVDDGSEDMTAEIAEAAGAVTLRHSLNSGKGVALNTGFLKAREFSPEVAITLDGDWQHLPEEIERVAAPVLSGAADIVVGSRYIENTSEVPTQRVVGHRGFNWLTNVASGVSLTDSQSGYRAFSLKAINTLVFSSNSFSVESEMQFLAKDHGLRILEVPITIRYHEKPKRNVIMHGLIVLNGLLRIVAQHRPLLFFAFPGLVTLFLGLLLSAWVVYSYNLYSKLGIGTALIVVILLLGGILSLFTGIMLHTMRALIIEIREGTSK